MVKFLVMDVDGTLTDGKIYMGCDGETFKAFSIKDGCGIKDILPSIDVEPVIITARESEILKQRCDELGILNLFQGERDKLKCLGNFLHSYNLERKKSYGLSDCIYIGDDILDYTIMQNIKMAGGIVACPADAVNEIKVVADYICCNKAGEGAVREVIDWLKQNEICFNGVKNLSSRIDEAIKYIDEIDKANLRCGKYEVNDWFYYTVQYYRTKKKDECVLESHRKYVDIQWMVKGNEIIEVSDITRLKLKTEYDAKDDIMYWNEKSRMISIKMVEGSYIVLNPSDAHMGCICCDKVSEDVIKIVGKVKV